VLVDCSAMCVKDWLCWLVIVPCGGLAVLVGCSAVCVLDWLCRLVVVPDVCWNGCVGWL